jgi:hypothetical protein
MAPCSGSSDTMNLNPVEGESMFVDTLRFLSEMMLLPPLDKEIQMENNINI